MLERKTVPIDDESSIAVVTERMSDGSWAGVASIKRQSATGEKVTGLPVRDARYSTQAEAEQAAISEARDWITHNMPRAA